MILLHGDYQLKSRERLNQLLDQAREKKQELVRLDGLSLTEVELVQALESGCLFGQDRLVIIENLLSRPKSKLKDKLIGVLKQDSDKEVVLWEKKTIDGRALRPLSFIQAELFKMPVSIFKFLDNVKPNNKRAVLEWLEQAKLNDPVELIFYLLAGRVRNLIMAQTSPKDLIGAPWQRAQLHQQAKAFSLEQLTQFYQQMLIIDRKIKTGRAVFDLAGQLDLLILGL